MKLLCRGHWSFLYNKQYTASVYMTLWMFDYCVWLQKQCHCLSSTAHWSVISMNQWCSLWRRHIEHLLTKSLLIAGVQAPREAWHHVGRLQQPAMLPWRLWHVVISNRWCHATCLQQLHASHYSEQTVWMSTCHTVRDSATTTTSCATVTGRDDTSNWTLRNTSTAGHRAVTTSSDFRP